MRSGRKGRKGTLDMTAGKPAALLLRFSLPLILDNLFQQGIFQAFCASAGAAVIVSAIGQGMLAPVLRLLRTPEELFGMTYLYLGILYIGIPVSFAYNMLAAILRAFGNSRAPLIAVITASFSNIFFDILFVMKWEMGIRGASYGTLLSQVCSVIYCIVALSRIRQARVEPCNRKIKGRMLAEQIKLGVPMGVQNIITAAGGLVVQSVVNGFGILFLAGYTAANKLYGLLETAASSYGYAISTYTAQNAGSGKRERIRSGLLAALVIGAVTAYLMSFIMAVWGKPILGLFIADSQVETEAALRIGYQFLCILAAFFPLLYILYILRSCIQGMGNSTMPMLSSLMQVAMHIVCAVAVTKRIGNTGVFWGEVMAWLGADVFLVAVLLWRYRTDSCAK